MQMVKALQSWVKFTSPNFQLDVLSNKSLSPPLNPLPHIPATSGISNQCNENFPLTDAAEKFMELFMYICFH